LIAVLDWMLSQSRSSQDGAGVSRTSARRVLGYLTPYRRQIAAASACLLVQTLLTLAPVLIVKDAIDLLERHHASFGRIAALAAAGLVLTMLAGLINVLRTWLVLRVTTRIVTDLRDQLVDRLMSQSIGYFTGTRGGDLMSRILNDVNAVAGVLGDTALSFIGDVITAVVCLAAMFVFEWRLAVVTLLVFPPLVIILRLGSRAIYRTRREVQERLGDFTVHAQEVLSLSGIMLVKSFGREGTERGRSRGLTDDLRRSQVSAGMTAQWLSLGLQLTQYIGPVVLLLAGGWLVVHHYASLGTIIAFVTVLSLRFGVAVANVGTGAVSLIGVLPAWDRIFSVLDHELGVGDRPDAVALQRSAGAVSFDAVSFRYPRQRRWAVNDVTLDAAPGQLVALVGPSGAGKTTLTSLLARFYDPDQGAIRIDGQDLRDLKLESIAQAIGLVLQDTYLLHGTLRENLLYAQPDATDEQLLAACQDACLDGLLAELPDGLGTVVGERGHRLSGGEKQRVAIARVILKNSPILILDEATSSLDSLAERFVQAALARLFAGRTSFVIAHRLSTVLAADMIAVLDGGQIVERGTHDELLAAGGLYAGLYELQFRPPNDLLVPDPA
jgi:ATP-binding cassette subfamily B protein